nr:DUF924 family protein [Qipengyuania sphaerica]
MVRTWFDEVGPSHWYNSTPEIDAMLRTRFGDFLEKQGQREADDFLTDPQSALGAILLFDQVPRNIHRDTPRAFQRDTLAQAIAHGMIDKGWTQELPAAKAQFALMPLMHSEKLADQDACVVWFAKLAPDALDYARSHREAIARFGRFPHRNEILGRETTPQEQAAIDDGLSW